MRTPLLFAVLLVTAVCPLVSGQASTATAARPTVLITGANRGLGLEFARQFAAAGYDVIGTARRSEAAKELAATGARVLALDVADAASVKQLALALDGQAIDILINNAGISGGGGGRLAALDIDAARRVLDVNTLGPIRVTQALLPNLRKGERKMVVNISSQLGSIERNRGGYYGYRESKSALNQFTRTLAAELAPDGFICIAMSPGWVRTDMGGPNATLSPEESITGMRNVIAKATKETSGQFLSYDGTTLPW